MSDASAVESIGSGRFELRNRIGHGAVGVVYDAFDRDLRSRVALKALRTVSPEHILSLKNEFRAVQDLQHANLVNLGELFEDGGQWFFTMEFVDGRNFLQYVCEDDGTGRAGSYDETRLRAGLAQLARGLSALHAAQKVHRDVKPTNILVSNEGRVVVLDFGVASDLLRESGGVEDGVVGTVAYMAPEQAVSESATPASDWYAVGVILYQALTGQLPFSGNGAEILEHKISREPPPPVSLAPSIPRDLNDLCVSLLRMAPEDRPAGAAILSLLGIAEEDDALGSSSGTQVFIGRESELSALCDAFATSRKDGAVSVLVHGESGVGKSYLVRTFTEQIREANPSCVVFRGRCYERESVPYKAIDGVVDDLAAFVRNARASAEETELLSHAEAQLLAHVFPVLADSAPEMRASISGVVVANPQELRLRIFSALTRVLARIAERTPLVVVIDDLQWADADSLALLAEVLRPPHAPKMLLVATQRTATEIRKRAPDAPVPLGLPGDVRHVQLEQLSLVDSELLITKLLGGEATTEDDVRAIAHETGGHPLFIDELIRQRQRTRKSDAPLRLDDALWSRVSKLDAAPRRLLELVCVAAVPISQETAAQAAAIDLGQFFYLASVLRASHLVRTTGIRREDTMEAYHDRVRESVLAHLDNDARKDWHGRLALALERSSQGDPETLAIHWRGAENLARAAEYTELAADQATRALAFDRAVRLYQAALELRHDVSSTRAAGGGGVGAADRGMRTKLADALTNAGRGAEAAETRLELARDADPIVALDLQRRAAEQFLCSGHFDRGIVLLRDVLAKTGTRFPQSPIAIIFYLLCVRLLLRVRGVAFVERDVAKLDRAELLSIDATRSAGAGFSMSDNVLGAYFQTNHLLLALKAGDTARILHALAMEVCFTSGGGVRAHAKTRMFLRETELLAARVGTVEAEGVLAIATGYHHYFVGEWKEAKDWLVRTDDTLRNKCVGLMFEANSARAMLFRTMCNLGVLRELGERVPGALREVEHQGDIYSAINLRTTAALLLGLADDDPRRVAADLEWARAHLARSRFLVQHYFCLGGQAQLHMYEGNGGAAFEHMMASWPALQRSLLLRIQAIRVFAVDQRARAALMAACAKETPASKRASLLQVAERDSQKLAREGAPWAVALSELLSAGVADARGQKDIAVATFERATGSLSRAHMALYAAAARRRHGELLGGEAGKSLIEQADAWSTEERIARPQTLATVLTPSRVSVPRAS